MRPLPIKIYTERALNEHSGIRLLIGLGIFLSVCSILYFGQAILIPIVLAILLAVLLTPIVKVLQKINVPKPAAIIFVVALTFIAIFSVAALVGTTVTNLAN